MLEYLKEAAREESDDPRPFTSAGIQRRLRSIPPAHINSALQTLSEKDRLTTATALVKVYLPANEDGKRVLKRLATARTIGVHLGWAIFLTVAAVGLSISGLDLYTGYVGDPAIVAAQKTAFNDAMQFVALVCIPLGVGVSQWLGHLRRLTITKDRQFGLVQKFSKWTFWGALLPLAGYFVYARSRGAQFDLAIAVALAGLGIVLTSGYFFFLHRPTTEESQ